MPSARVLILFGLIALLSACSVTTVRTSVTIPPRIALGVFPRVLLVPKGPPEATHVATELAQLLAAENVAVELVVVEEAMRRNREGLVDDATAVVIIDLALHETIAVRRVQRSSPCFGRGPCFSNSYWFDETYPKLIGVASVALYDARSSTLLDRDAATFEQQDEEFYILRPRVLDLVTQWARATISSQERRVAVEFVDCGGEFVDSAIDAFRERRFDEALSGIEHALALHPDEETRACLLFDRAQMLVWSEAPSHAVALSRMADAETHLTAVIRSGHHLDRARRAEAQLVERRQATERAVRLDEARTEYRARAIELPAAPPSYLARPPE
jgi:hypothetical protein